MMIAILLGIIVFISIATGSSLIIFLHK